MSYRNTSVLANYNPLTDPHLAAHYSSTRKRKDLKSAGLVSLYKGLELIRISMFKMMFLKKCNYTVVTTVSKLIYREQQS